jgi:hypothetical protein
VADIVRARRLTVHVVDTFGDLLSGDGPPAEFPGFLAAVGRFGILDRLVVHPCRSVEAAKRELPFFDLVFIDADHSYEAVLADVRGYGARVARGGVLAGHDEGYESVRRALAETVGEWERLPDSIWAVRNFRGLSK